jgi:hypothetical protein
VSRRHKHLLGRCVRPCGSLCVLSAYEQTKGMRRNTIRYDTIRYGH